MCFHRLVRVKVFDQTHFFRTLIAEIIPAVARAVFSEHCGSDIIASDKVNFEKVITGDGGAVAKSQRPVLYSFGGPPQAGLLALALISRQAKNALRPTPAWEQRALNLMILTLP